MCCRRPGGARLRELSAAAPRSPVVDVFRLKYDYHNAKVLVKAEAMGIDAGRLLLDGGRVPAPELAEGYQKEQLGGLSPAFKARSGRPGDPGRLPTTRSCPTWLWTGPAMRRWPSWPKRPGAPFSRGMSALRWMWPT